MTDYAEEPAPPRPGSFREEARLYRRLIRYLTPYKAQLGLVLVFNFLFVIMNALSIWMIAPFLTTLFHRSAVSPEPTAPGSPGLLHLNAWLKAEYLRVVVRPDPIASLNLICVLIFSTFLLKNLFQFLESWAVSYVEQKVIKDLRDELYEKILYKPISFFARFPTGNLISRLTNDINAVNVAINRSFTKIIREPVVIVTFILILLSISWWLTLIAVIIVPLSGVIIQWIGSSLRRKSRRAQERIAEVTSGLQDTLSGIRVVQAFAQENTEVRRFRERSRRHFEAMLRMTRMNRLSSPLSETLGMGIMVGVLWFGGREVLVQNRLSSEDFIRFLSVLFAVLAPIKSLADLNANLQTALASGARIFEVMDDPAVIRELPHPVAKTAFERDIEYRNVRFRYDPGTDWILDGVSFHLDKNQKLALVGPSGAGKSTVINLLPRFYDVLEGAIRVDGVDLRELRLRDLRRLIGVVSQEVTLFSDTVANNIAYGQEGVSRDRIVEAARLAHALDFVRALPEGFDTEVGERGFRLSGGERQRISIARAVLSNPPILILDEATSNLDSESERLIQQAIETLLQDRTVLMIAHRLSTVVRCDRILLLEKGRILDEGTHHELLERSARYQHFYQLQFSA